jgi:peptide/nickel transport system substrate-binding protein
MRRPLLRPLLALLALLAVAPAGASQRLAEGRIAIAHAVPPSGMDPHSYGSISDLSVLYNVYEALFHRDGRNRLVPGLATAWHAADETTWEVTLRQGVVFHDGTPFAAEDVVASYARVPLLRTSLRSPAIKLQAIASIELLGPHALRIRTNRPAPELPDELATIAVLRRAALSVLEPEPFNALREAIGTGPFRATAYTPEAALELARHEAWWGPTPPWREASLRFIPKDAVRAAALLAGDIDVMERVAPADMPVLAARPGIALSRAPGLNTVYVALSLARPEAGPYTAAADGTPLAHNPLRDVRVRRALALAVNRAALTERLLAGAAVPASQLAAPGTPDFQADILPPAQDIPAARALLAEAGLGAGLQLTLLGPTDRFPNITQVAEALAQNWSRIGVATRVETMPWNSMARRAGRGEFAGLLFGCCAAVPGVLTVTRNLLVTHDAGRGLGASNYGRYADPVLDRTVLAGMASFDPAIRFAAAGAAARIVAEEVPLIPLYHPLNVWAARAPLEYEPRLDSYTPVRGAQAQAPGGGADARR